MWIQAQQLKGLNSIKNFFLDLMWGPQVNLLSSMIPRYLTSEDIRIGE